MNEITKINQNKVNVTKGQYALYQQRYNEYLNKNDLQVNPESVRAYLESLSEMSASTQRKAKTSIKQALEDSTLNPVTLLLISKEFKKIKTKKADKKVLHYLTKRQITYIKVNAPSRVALIIECLEQTGLRISELLSIKSSQIECTDKENCTVRVTGKGKKERTIYLSEKTVKECQNIFKGYVYLIETMRGKKYGRLCVNTMFKRVSNKLSIKFTPHSFRHSYASRQIIENDKTLKSVSNYLGHSSTSITADMYVHDSLTPQEAVLI